MSTDSSGQQAVDFVWGALPVQPNDDRAATISNTGGTTGSDLISYKTFVVTAASASGGVVTYTSANTLQVGEIVTITGLSTSAFNLTNVTVGTVSGTQFTVTNAATGTAVTGATAVAKAVEGVLPGVGADYNWSATTQVASGRLDPALDNHANVEAGWAGYPGYIPAAGNYIVTAAVGNGTTVTYTSQNFLAAGATVNITGLTASAYNLTSATVATANATSFTVTNSANAGTITGQTGKVQSTTAATDADGVGLGNIIVPNVLGATTAVALDLLLDAGYETASITTASAAANAAKTVTAATRTAASTTLVFTASGAGAAYGVGTKVTVSAFTGDDAVLNGTYTVIANATNTFSVTTTATTAVALTAQSASVVGVAGTIKTQSTAANAADVATTATITITPWAAAS
jgi:hypothetical protein